MPRLRLALVTAVLLALPTVAAGEPAHYVAQALEANGEAVAIGPLAALSLVGTGGLPVLAIEAEAMRVEVDRYYDQFHSPWIHPAVTNATGGTGEWSSDSVNFTKATAAATAVREAFRVFIVPDDEALAEVRSPLLKLVPSAQDSLPEPGNIDSPDRATVSGDVGDAFEVVNRAGSRSVRLSGDFLMVLWETDLEVRDAERAETFRTGAAINEVGNLPDPTGTGLHVLGEYDARQAYVFVRNGTLELAADDVTWEALFLHATRAAATGSFTLTEALRQDVAVPAESPRDLRFPGPVACVLGRSEGESGPRLEAWLVADGGSKEVEVAASPPDALGLLPAAEGDPAGPSATAAAWRAVPAWLGASLVVLALVALAVVTARLVAQSRAMRSLRGHMDAGEFEEAVEEVEGALRSRRHRREASVIGIVAALQLADVARARDLLRRARWSLADDPGLEPFLDACIAAASHDDDRARTLLRDSLRLDGSLAEHARGNPFLARVLQPETLEPGYT